MRKELLEGLTPEQIEKIRNCKDAGEALKIAKEEGVELNEEQLAAVSGGSCVLGPVNCPICNSDKVNVDDKSYYYLCTCKNCGHSWRI